MGWSSASHLRSSIGLAVSWLAVCFGSLKHEKTGFGFFFLLFRKWIPQAGWNVLPLVCSFEDALQKNLQGGLGDPTKLYLLWASDLLCNQGFFRKEVSEIFLTKLAAPLAP